MLHLKPINTINIIKNGIKSELILIIPSMFLKKAINARRQIIIAPKMEGKLNS